MISVRARVRTDIYHGLLCGSTLAQSENMVWERVGYKVMDQIRDQIWHPLLDQLGER